MYVITDNQHADFWVTRLQQLVTANVIKGVNYIDDVHVHVLIIIYFHEQPDW